MRNWCHGSGKVKPATRAKACAASAEWEGIKAKAHASHAVAAGETALDPGFIALGSLEGPLKLGWELTEDISPECPKLSDTENANLIVSYSVDGDYELRLSDGTPVPLVPDMHAWNMMGVPPMDHLTREKRIAAHSDKHTKLDGKHQKIPKGSHVLDEEITLTSFVDKPWDGSASKYGSTEAYCSACLIDENPSGQAKTQSMCHLPIKEPDGSVNKGALRAAASRLNQVQASSESKAKAKGRLQSLMKEAGINTNLSEGQENLGLLKRIALALGFSSVQISEPIVEEDTDVELAAPALKVGAKVSFTQGGKSYTGTILGIDRSTNTAKIKVEGSDWSPDIPLGSLKLLGAPVNASDQVLIQAPVVTLDAKEIGPGRFRKALLPVEKAITYKRNGAEKVLHFSREMLSKMVDNFKQKAFDNVPLLAAHPEDSAVNPEHYYGHLADVEMDDEWLYGIFETTDRGTKAILDNPNLPTSPGYLEDYTRNADKKHFGPSLQHIAFAYTPAVPGVKGWEPVVAMSSKDAVVVDLSGETFADNPRKEDDRLDVQPEAPVEPQKEKEEEVEMEESTPTGVSLEEFNTLRDENREALKQLAENQRVLRHQGIRKMLNEEYGQAGVAKVHLDAAFDLLVAEEGVITLSESGDAAFTDENKKALAVKTLLESCKGEIEFGEKGSQTDGSDNHEAEKMYEEYLSVLGGES